MFGSNHASFYEEIIRLHINSNAKLIDNKATAGGCINNSQQLRTNHGIYFLKWNDSIPDDMFPAEMKGLKLLSEPGLIKIPETIASGKIRGKNYLLMECIDTGRRLADYWENFGQTLAEMHRVTSDSYGLDHDNYIGSLPQKNEELDDWIEFFINHRLEAQLNLALKNGLVSNQFADRYRAFYHKLNELLPENPASLLHGDLWSGNVMVGSDGHVCLIDPAVYYGHREIELAFTQMFGGFETTFYDSYHNAYPLDPGFNERVQVYNIYPHMVHVNLFGTSYLSGVNSVLDRYL